MRFKNNEMNPRNPLRLTLKYAHNESGEGVKGTFLVGLSQPNSDIQRCNASL
jgi:hypothetical protein